MKLQSCEIRAMFERNVAFYFLEICAICFRYGEWVGKADYETMIIYKPTL